MVVVLVVVMVVVLVRGFVVGVIVQGLVAAAGGVVATAAVVRLDSFFRHCRSIPWSWSSLLSR